LLWLKQSCVVQRSSAHWLVVAKLVCFSAESEGICRLLSHCLTTVCHVEMQVMQQIMQMTVLPLQQRLRSLLTASDVLN